MKKTYIYDKIFFVYSSVVKILENTKRLSVSQNALYNTIGTVTYCFCQWIISALLVVHLSPNETAVYNTGLLQLSISITNIFFAISTFDTRTYQISDVKNTYSYGDYIGMRFVTAALAMVLCIAYVLFFGYPLRTVLCIVFYMIFKLNETFSDVLHAIDQKNYRMDYVGFSFCARGLLMVFAFALSLLIFGDVIIAIIAMAISSHAIVIFFDIKHSRQFGSIKPLFNKKTLTRLIITCLPAVISATAFTAITSIPRQILEGMQGEEALGYYGTIATPIVVVQVMATSIFNPMLTEFSVLYNNGNIGTLVRRLLKNLLLLVCVAGIVLVCVAFLGEFAVGLVFGKEFVPYTYLMYGIVGCTSMYVISWLCVSVLIIMRKLKVCMVTSLISLTISTISAQPLINLFGMNGVSFAIILSYVVHITVCSIIIYLNLKAKGKQR